MKAGHAYSCTVQYGTVDGSESRGDRHARLPYGQMKIPTHQPRSSDVIPVQLAQCSVAFP